jgi:hypothetical protein
VFGIAELRKGILLMIKTKDYSVHAPQTSQTFIAIEYSSASAATVVVPLMKVGEVKERNAGGSTAVVVVTSPSASVTEIENPMVYPTLYIWSTSAGTNVGAVLTQTM